MKILKNLLLNEIVNCKVSNVRMTSAVSSTNESVCRNIKNDIKKYDVSHGSHSQHHSG